MQDAALWNAVYIVQGRQAILGAINFWFSVFHMNVKVKRIGEPHSYPQRVCSATPKVQRLKPWRSWHIQGLCSSAVPSNDTVFIEAKYEVKPRMLRAFMPPFVIWSHTILTLADTPEECEHIIRKEFLSVCSTV